MKCPACGFETPDAQGWCDFCKEPFRKAASPADAAPSAHAPAAPAPSPSAVPASAAPAPAAQVPSPAAVSASAVPAPKAPASGAGVGPAVLTPEQAFEMLRLDPGERIPVVPAGFRYFAWIMLAVFLLLAAVMTVSLMDRASRMSSRGEAAPAVQSPAEEEPLPPPEPIPAEEGGGDSSMTRG